jgi:murein DD-endopeptidase MepM/ murein hydrolase activator NlpD
MRILGPAVIAIAAAGGWAYLTVLESDPPIVSTRTQSVFVGPEYVHELEVADLNRGVQSVRVALRTATGEEHVLEEQTFEGSLFGGAALKTPRRIEVKVNPKALKVADGRATLVLEAVDFSLRGNRTVVEVPLVIDTRAPGVQVRTGLTYVRRGGSELAVYTMDEEVTRHGVMVGEQFYPGFPHPTEKGVFAAFYGMPWQKDGTPEAKVVAYDRAGNQRAVTLSTRLLDFPLRLDQIQLTDEFMRSKVEELGGDTSDVLASYVKINRDTREQNAREIRKICEHSSPERLWSEPFIQMSNSKVGAGFAEQRSYVYQGKEVDQQVHLGFDLASTARAPVPAANDGVVAFAGPLGIYGQTVLIDHGMGLFSLYGHLSEMSVQKGQAIARGEIMGRTGTTGLAGGDHLHYGILLSGEFVDPIEWFDKKWIREHLEAKLQPAEPPASAEPGPDTARGKAGDRPADADDDESR